MNSSEKPQNLFEEVTDSIKESNSKDAETSVSEPEYYNFEFKVKQKYVNYSLNLFSLFATSYLAYKCYPTVKNFWHTRF